MKRSELKNIIKECVREVIFEEGIVSNLVAEIAYGITKSQQVLVESTADGQKESEAAAAQAAPRDQAKKKKLLETKRKMLDAMGNSKLSNVFEGTKPLQQGGTPGSASPHGPLAGRDPTDAGVDISGLFGATAQKWKHLK